MLHHYPDPGVDCHFTESRRWWQAISSPELRIVICCDVIEVFIFHTSLLPGSKTELVSHQHYPCTGDERDESPDETMWQKLREILAQLTGKRWHVVVVLSNQYSRWLVLPWQSEIRSQADREAYCRHALQQSFGMSMDGWSIQSQSTGYGKTTLVNASAPGLIEKLSSLFAEHHLTPGIIVPAWMLSVNQTLYMIKKQVLTFEGWLICRESNSLTMGYMIKGEWQKIFYVAVNAQWRQTLHEVLLREQVINPEVKLLPVFLSQAQFSSVSKHSLAPFTLLDVQPSKRFGESFHQQLRGRLA